MSATQIVPARSLWLPALSALAIGLAVLLTVFAREARAAVAVWSGSTAFGHCFLVLPIAAWLLWERRARLAWLAPQPLPLAALLMLPCAALWLFAERLGLMEGRQLAALISLWVLALAVFGPRVAFALSVPLGYLIFLVPFGAFLVPALQDFTARFVDIGLELLGIPHFVDQVIIEIPEGRFMVAEACAGLRFLIAAVAFGALYAFTLYRSPGRRMVFILVSIAVPIIANGLRALGIVGLGHLLGSAQAGAVDHVLYGWLFFSVVILLLVLLGLPFREDGSADTTMTPDPPGPASGFTLAALAALGAVCLGPACAWSLDRRAMAERPQAARIRLDAPPICQALPGGTEDARRFTCGTVPLVVHIAALGPHAGAGAVLAWFHAAEAGPPAEDVEHGILHQGGGTWRLVSTSEPESAAAMAVWLDGAPAAGGLMTRLALARRSLFGGPAAPVVTTIAATGHGAEAAVRAMVAGVSQQ